MSRAGRILWAILASTLATGCAPGGETPPPPPAPGFGPGFTDIGAGLRAAPPCSPLDLAHVPDGEPTTPDALLADLDREGADEVVASCVGANAVPAPAAVAYRYDPTDGSLTPAPSLLPQPAVPVVGALDLDRDGHQDLILDDGGFKVAWGLPAGGFGPASSLAADVPPGVGLYLADVDGDGWLDALVGDGLCQAGHADVALLLRTGLRAFTLRRDLVPGGKPVNPYTVLAVDGLPGKPDLLFTIGGRCFPDGSDPFKQVASRDADGFPHYAAVDPLPPDAVFRQEDKDPADDISHRAPMGAATGDLDEDGHPDLVVTIDPAVELFLGGDAWPYRDVSQGSGVYTVDAASGLAAIPWGVSVVDVDGDGREDLVVAYGNDQGAWRDPNRQIGPQTLVVDWNGGNLRFADVSHALHVDDPGQWRALFVGDLDGDGDPDVAVGGMGVLPAIYRNDIDEGTHGFALRLVGTSSNRLALGASVEVWPAGGGAPRRYTVPRVADSELVETPEIFVGLGQAQSAYRVRITWPTGVVQALDDVAAGADHRVVEPALFDLDPVGRHLPADGASVLTVTVHPRNPDGTVRAGATVAVTPAGGEAVTVGAPSVLADGSVAFTLVAPATPGSTRLAISVDGVVSPVHPRVWWE